MRLQQRKDNGQLPELEVEKLLDTRRWARLDALLGFFQEELNMESLGKECSQFIRKTSNALLRY